MMQPGPAKDLKPEHREPDSVSGVGHQPPAMTDQSCMRSDGETCPAASTRTHAYRKSAAKSVKAGGTSSRGASRTGPGKTLCRSWHGEGREATATTLQDTDPTTLTEGAALVPNGSLSRTERQAATSKVDLESPVKNDVGGGGGGGGDDGGSGLGAKQQQAPVVVVKKDGEDDGGEEERRRRLRCRLMVWVTVALLSYITAMLSIMPVLSQYIFRRTAMAYFNLTNVTKHRPPCAGEENSTLQDALNIIQEKTSRRLLGLELSQFLPAIFVALLFGSYADYVGRKVLVLVPIVGAFLKSLVVLLVIYLDWDLNFLFLGSVLEGFLGSFYVLQLGIFASIADVTISSRQRVLLFAVLEISVALSGAISQIGTGLLIDALGFAAPSLIVSCLFLVSCACILLFVPETLHSRPQRLVLNPLVHLRKVFGFYFWDGSVSQRALFLCGQLVLFLVTMINLGRLNMETLFVINSPLCWGPVQLGIFMGIKILMQNLIGVLALKALTRCVRIELIGMVGLVSGAAGFGLQAFAQIDPMMYLSAAVGVLISVVSPIARTLLSRMVPASSQGALFASMSAVETVCHMTASIVYNGVYMATLDVFPGAVFLLMAAILLADCALLILFTMMSRKFPHFQEVQVEVPSPGADASPSPAPLRSRPPDDETTPLLFNKGANTRDRFRNKRNRLSTSV